MSKLRQALSATESDLKDCRGARIGLQEELRRHAKALRLLEKKAKSVKPASKRVCVPSLVWSSLHHQRIGTALRHAWVPYACCFGFPSWLYRPGVNALVVRSSSPILAVVVVVSRKRFISLSQFEKFWCGRISKKSIDRSAAMATREGRAVIFLVCSLVYAFLCRIHRVRRFIVLCFVCC